MSRFRANMAHAAPRHTNPRLGVPEGSDSPILAFDVYYPKSP